MRLLVENLYYDHYGVRLHIRQSSSADMITQILNENSQGIATSVSLVRQSAMPFIMQILVYLPSSVTFKNMRFSGFMHVVISK